MGQTTSLRSNSDYSLGQWLIRIIDDDWVVMLMCSILVKGISELKWKRLHLNIVLEYSWKAIYEGVAQKCL